MVRTRLLFLSALMGLVMLIPAAGHAQEISLRDIVELLIKLDIIPADRVERARDAIENLDNSIQKDRTPPIPTYRVCERLFGDDVVFRVGMSDRIVNGPVTRLQKFLAEDPSIYPEAIVSGYYGELTVQAVQRFQAKHGIVSSGSPERNGYGLVGPATKRALQRCRDAGLPDTPKSLDTQDSTKERTEERKTTNRPEATTADLREFAQCLATSGATFYGAFWCPNCAEQKRLFGEAASALPYVECSTPDGTRQVQRCVDEKIRSYPTWEFADGSRLIGRQSPQELAEKTSCELPLGYLKEVRQVPTTSTTELQPF